MKILDNFIKGNRDNTFYKLAILRGVCMSHSYCSNCPYYRETTSRRHCLVTDCITRRYGSDCSFSSPASMHLENLVELLDLEKDAPSIEELNAMDENILKAALEIEIPDE